MTPLEVRVYLGQEDKRLIDHIRFLEVSKSQANDSNGISAGEERLLRTLYDRLDYLTNPTADYTVG